MTGRVLDETKAGVPGATVIVKGSTRGVITGNDGTFSIDVKPTDVIEISYLGYETQSIPVGTKTNIVTELVRKVSELEAVTVVAYGKQRKESIIGAINTIDAGELEVASGSLSSNLAGKLAGIVVMQRTGEPGSADRVRSVPKPPRWCSSTVSSATWTLSTRTTSPRSPS